MNTVLHRLSEWSKASPNSVAQRYLVGGQWRNYTAQEYFDRVYFLALYLESEGFDSTQVGAILSYNCPAWVHLDLAFLLVGGKSAGLYPNSSTKDIHYILGHTEATVLAVQNKDYFKKILENGTTAWELPKTIRKIIVFDGNESISPLAIGYERAVAIGKDLAAKVGIRKASDFLKRIDSSTGAFLIYTSGTTGDPKGALISHDNLAYTSDLAARHWKLPFGRGGLISFLPLCHIAEKLQNVGVGITQRYSVSFCSSFDRVSAELVEVQPTLLLSVPRLWEKMMEGVQAKVHSEKIPKKYLLQWALDVGAKRASNKGFSPALFAQNLIADKVVLSKIRQALGLAHAELLASGAASLPAHVSRWFRTLGLEIVEDFGQTESTGVICMTELGVDSAGTVGKPVPGTEFKLAPDGEILTKGRHVFVGYYKNPVATAETIKDGWLYTGDLGEVNEKGLIHIRGRKKEIMKTSGGKMIAPLPIEEKLKAAEIISQVCLVGDGRKFLSALITLSESTYAELKANQAFDSGKLEVTQADIIKAVQAEVTAVNATLAGYEQIKKFAVISREFSIVDSEMTPTLKMKRNVIEERFKSLIDSMYSAS